MKFSLSWLKNYLDTTASVTEIADTLTAIGLEVEEVEDKATALQGFIIGEIKTVEKHPNADKLNLLTVWTGTETLQIVCGAPNCKVGMKGVLALPGTNIPKFNEVLEKGVIRGIESCGMMCAEDELCIGDDHNGIIELNTDAPAGTPFVDVLKPDVVFDINVTPNRGDCFGIKGIARDLAAAGIGTLKNTDVQPIKGTFKSPVSVTIETPDCPVFVGRYIKGVKNGESPDWLKHKLLAVGLRPISILVDVTNYFNIGECRPLHVFDADKLTGNIMVRSAKDGEKIQTLDDKEYTLSDGMVVVADDKNAQSIAGIMGGIDTAVSKNTTNVFLEAAYFEPMSIAKTGRALNAESDSRSRFERGVDAMSTIQGNENAAQLILDLCGGEASELVIAGEEPDTTRRIDFDFGLVKKLCGIDLSAADSTAVLEKLGFTINGTTVTVPSWRHNDVFGSNDIVEEIVRIAGYDKLPALPMRAADIVTSTLTPTQKREVAVRRALADNGLCQAVTWSFMDSTLAELFNSKKVMIQNPIASDLNEMRPSLVPNLLSATKRNLDRGQTGVQLFEVGPEFAGVQPGQQRMVACAVRAGVTHDRHWDDKGRTVDCFDAKSDAYAGLAAIDAPANMQVYKQAPAWYHPGRSGSLCLGKNVLAHFGEIHPKILATFGIKVPVVACEIYLDNVPMPKAKSKTQKPLKASSLMPLTRDFAFVMDTKVEAAKLLSSIQSVDKDLIRDARVFDVYEGDKLPDGKKSLAVEVVIQPSEKTLTDEEIDSLSRRIVACVNKNTGAELRS